MKTIKQNHCKGKNFRVLIELLSDENGHLFFELKTKRLIDFKSREIVHMSQGFRPETFIMIANVMFRMFDASLENVLKSHLEEMKTQIYEFRSYENIK